jgi:two-component system chemotaxis sensor kinase CheA
MSGPGNVFFSDLFEDYYAETDEHLTEVRRALVALEPFVHQTRIDRAPVEVLQRSFHTIKGLSGMVGLKEAEEVAHRVETYLRALLKGQVGFFPEAMEALVASAKTLEQIIGAHRLNETPPAIAQLLANLDGLVATTSPRGEKAVGVTAATVPSEPVAPGGEEDEKLREAISSGFRVWRFEFSPRPELASRGINVNVIRNRLREIGELIRAIPHVEADGNIKFEFLVATHEDEESFAARVGEGIIYTPFSHEAEAAPFPNPDVVKSATSSQGHEARSVTSTNVVRVDLTRLDELILMIGKAVVSRAYLEDRIKLLQSVAPTSDYRSLQETSLAMERQLRSLREGIMRLRMVSIRHVFERMQFAARDLAREQQKSVIVEIYGQDTEIDKYVVEQMFDPLLHLVRNAISHGIETREERISRGKTPEGRLVLRAMTAGGAVILEVEDDGRGMEAEFIAGHARRIGMIASDTELDPAGLLDVLCETGFSTREQADMVSGRGIGMSIVKRAVQELDGMLSFDTQPGMGTRFSIRLPLTLAIVEAFIVSVGDQVFAVPVSSTLEAIEIAPEDLTVFENNEILPYRDTVLPLVRLSEFFGIEPNHGYSSRHGLVLGDGMSHVGVVVDRILGQREIVVRQLIDSLIQIPGLAGATEIGDGRVVLILDTKALIDAARNKSPR